MSSRSLCLPVAPVFPALLGLSLALAGCSNDTQYTVRFAAQVGGQPLRCDTTYPGLGTTGSTVQLLDFKAYVRDVTLVRANGEEHPLVLEQDGRWQRDAIALLDFEDGTGTCDTGSPDVRTEVVGRAPAFDDYTGVRFSLGPPPELNHLDGATAPPPLNAPSMWWSWKAGYKFLRLDVRTRANPQFLFHLGASGCQGTPASGFTCAQENQVALSRQDFDPERSRIVFDLAALYAETDLDAQVSGAQGGVPGCMSDPADPECPALLSRVGLGSESALSGGAAFIRVE